MNPGIIRIGMKVYHTKKNMGEGVVLSKQQVTSRNGCACTGITVRWDSGISTHFGNELKKHKTKADQKETVYQSIVKIRSRRNES